jgi:hypothetical protein
MWRSDEGARPKRQLEKSRGFGRPARMWSLLIRGRAHDAAEAEAPELFAKLRVQSLPRRERGLLDVIH